jgi:hypothetical protein
LFAAGWTLGSLKYLGESSVHSITYYETTGACGVMENGELFPVFHLLAEVGSIAGGEIIPCVSSNTLAVDGLALIQDGAIRVLIANLSATSQTIRIHGLAGNVYLRTLDSSTLQETRFVPTALRDQRGALLEGLAGELTMALSPHAIACIDSAPDAATRV